MDKPIIGVVTKHKGSLMTKRPLTFISDEIKNAVFAVGGVCIGIVTPTKNVNFVQQDNEQEVFENTDALLTNAERENLEREISLCDGIILAGGSDSDDYEVWIAAYCHKNDIPIIGICAGQNNIVRGVGGKTKKVSNPELHSNPDKDYVHSVFLLDKTGLLEGLPDSFMVNSRHKNTIMDPAGLEVVAKDEDGNMEIVQDKEKRCYAGIRFHPESLIENDIWHRKIFENFIKICSAK